MSADDTQSGSLRVRVARGFAGARTAAMIGLDSFRGRC